MDTTYRNYDMVRLNNSDSKHEAGDDLFKAPQRDAVRSDAELKTADSVDMDLKAEFEKRIKEKEGMYYFIADGNSDSIPELYPVRTDSKNKLVYSDADVCEDKEAKVKYYKVPLFETVFYGYETKDSTEKKLMERKSDAYITVYENDGKAPKTDANIKFYNVVTERKNQIVCEHGKEYPYFYALYNHYDTFLLYKHGDKYYTDNSKYVYDFLKGKKLSAYTYKDRLLSPVANKYASQLKQFRQNPIKLYPTSDLTALNNYNFNTYKKDTADKVNKK